MSTRFSISIVTSLVFAILCAQMPAVAQVERLTPKQLQEDFQIARHALEEAHGGLYRYSPKEVIDRRFDEVQHQLDTPTDALGFYRILQPAIVSIACGHTTSLLPTALKESLKKELLLPLDVKILEGRVFIFRDFTQAGNLAGQEIVGINGVPIKRILHTIEAATHHDANITSFRDIEAARGFKQSLYRLMDMRGSFSVTVFDVKSMRKKILKLEGQSLEKLEQASLQRYPQDQDSKLFLEYSFLDEGKIARLKIANFNDGGAVEDGASQLQTVFKAIQAKGSQTLLLDLRDNGGGEDKLGKLLFSYLIDQPFSYYDQLTITRDKYSFAQYAEQPLPRFKASSIEARPDGQFNYLRHPNVGLQQPSLPTFKGRVFILINGGSFSTTAEFLTQAHSHRRATFIGEESGGGYIGNTSGNHVILTLPNSKVRVVVPLLTYTLSTQHAQHPHAQDRGVIPDYPVQRSIDDYLNGRDPEWELALQLARKP